jgi:hypothetical protein
MKMSVAKCFFLQTDSTRDGLICYFAVVENFDTLALPELTAIQVRCIANRLLGASGKL